MDDLIGFTNGSDADVITQAAVSHAQFETIPSLRRRQRAHRTVLVVWALARRLRRLGAATDERPHCARPRRLPLGSVLVRTGELAVGSVVRGDRRVVIGCFARMGRRSRHPHERFARSRIADVRADAAAHAILEVLPAHPVITAGTAARFVDVSITAAASAGAAAGAGHRRALRDDLGRPRSTEAMVVGEGARQPHPHLNPLTPTGARSCARGRG